jgi:hypothetical protein
MKRQILLTMKADRFAVKLAQAQLGECKHVHIIIRKRGWLSGLLPSMCFLREWSGVIA